MLLKIVIYTKVHTKYMKWLIQQTETDYHPSEDIAQNTRSPRLKTLPNDKKNTIVKKQSKENMF